MALGREYYTGSYSGVYDDTVEQKVREFQDFMMLPVTGIANMGTIKQLMTSNGDTNRPAKACDASTIVTKPMAKSLVDAGYKVIGRY